MLTRRGYTLVEVIVAILIFTVGGLALAAGAATVSRTMASNNRRELATRLATSRLELLRAECPTATNGADSAAGVRSTWRVVASPGSIAVEETVSYQTAAGVRSETFHGSFACQ